MGTGGNTTPLVYSIPYDMHNGSIRENDASPLKADDAGHAQAICDIGTAQESKAIGVNSNPKDSSINITDGCIPTLTSKMQKGGRDVPLVYQTERDVIPIESHPQDGRIRVHGGCIHAPQVQTGTVSNNAPIIYEKGERLGIYSHPMKSQFHFSGEHAQTLTTYLKTQGSEGPIIYEHFQTESPNTAETTISTEQSNDKVYSLSHNSEMRVYDNITETLKYTDYKMPPPVFEVSKSVLRRITPTECARLQGFPDTWCDGLVNDNPTDDELEFWKSTWNEWCDSQNIKRKSRSQIKAWLRKTPTDASMYKAYGNSVAIPCVQFIMNQIVRVEEDAEYREMFKDFEVWDGDMFSF